MRGNADRHYGKQNALTLELDNHVIAEYRMIIHNASRRFQKAAKFLYNLIFNPAVFCVDDGVILRLKIKNPTTTTTTPAVKLQALTCLKLLASTSFRNVSDHYINVSQTKACCRVFKKFR